jgi:hypothetical protein
LPWSTTFDLGVQHQITISGNNKLELRADIFNIFNAENLSGSNNATQSNQIQGGSSASGLFYTKKCIATKTVSVWSSLFILIKLTSA